MTYDKDFLISELHRFVRENERIPTFIDIASANNYPSARTYADHFGSWNKALTAASFEINIKHRTLNGTETCSYCGCSIEETQHWYYDKEGNRFCAKHGANGKPDYVTKNLDINSSTGKGRTGEILVTKVLNIGKEHDCNRESCHYPIDMYNEQYGKIDVKTSLLNDKYNKWGFRFDAKKIVDTYICIGLNSDRSIVKHVWIIPNEGEIKNTSGITIRNTYRSLSTRKGWEVSVKKWNEIWCNMDLNKCNTMVDKSQDNYTKNIEPNKIVNNITREAKCIINELQYRLTDYY